MSDEAIICQRRNRWYFGGIASTCAAWVTHPMELIKVQLQTPTSVGEPISMWQIIKKIKHEEGFFGFYNGISAATLLRLTNSGARIGLYEGGKNNFNIDTIPKRFMLAIIAGTASPCFSMPFDKVNIRMQNDSKLPRDKRSNYKNVFDGVRRIYVKEGFKRLFEGYTVTAARGVFLAIGQNMSYDYAKLFLMSLPHATDNILLHFCASFIAGITSITMTQPLDVVKTRVINAKPGEYKHLIDASIKMAREEGLFSFYKGLIPASFRTGPQTAILFIVLEQLRLNFGFYDKDSPCYSAELIEFIQQ